MRTIIVSTTLVDTFRMAMKSAHRANYFSASADCILLSSRRLCQFSGMFQRPRTQNDGERRDLLD
jgi:hypothetical protein